MGIVERELRRSWAASGVEWHGCVIAGFFLKCNKKSVLKITSGRGEVVM